MKNRCPYCNSNRVEQIERDTWVCQKCGELFNEPISDDAFEYYGKNGEDWE